LKKNRLNKDLFIERSKKINNDKYDYSLVEYVKSHNKVKIICPKHGVFEQPPYVHLNGCGCSKCQISKGEEKIQEYLKYNNIEYLNQKSFNDCRYKQLLKFDFYIPKYNMCIEYDGEQYFEIRHKGGY